MKREIVPGGFNGSIVILMAEHCEPYEIDVGERAVGEAIVDFGLLPGFPLMVIEITGSVFQSEGQLLRLFGSEDNKQLSLLTMREDSENRSWAHLINGRLDSDYNLLQDTVQEQANVTFLD